MSKTPPKPPEPPEPPKPSGPAERTGRAVIDATGKSKWEWLSDTGNFRPDIDTARLKALGADLSCDDLVKLEARASNPYNKATVPNRTSAPGDKRRSLDDMRRLSEEIKAKQEPGASGSQARDVRKK